MKFAITCIAVFMGLGLAAIIAGILYYLAQPGPKY